MIIALSIWNDRIAPVFDFAMSGCGKQKGCENRPRLHSRRNKKITNYEFTIHKVLVGIGS